MSDFGEIGPMRRVRDEFRLSMLSVRKPTDAVVRPFLAQQAALDYSYEAVGATATQPPARHIIDHTRIRLGYGEGVFGSAVTALREWKQFDLGWVQACPTDTPIEKGAVVAVMGRAMGLWWLNACRVVYVIDHAGEVNRFGFAYGTLPAHVERGEERFLIEWNRSDDSVWYDIVAFSRPNHFATRVGFPLVRRAQRRFGRDSARAMLRAVAGVDDRSLIQSSSLH